VHCRPSVLLVAVLFSHCTPADQGRADKGSGASDAGQVQLEVLRSVQTDRVGSSPASPGDLYVVVNVRLRNSTSESLPLGAPHFSLTATNGLEFVGDPATSLHEDGCPQSASLGGGRDVACVVVFRAPEETVTTALSYSAPNGPTVTTSLATVPCGRCGNGCEDLSSSSANCGACGRVVGLGTCVNGEPVCNSGATPCGYSCVDTDVDSQHCGACDAAVVGEGVSCVNGQPHCSYGNQTYCSPVGCVDTDSDLEHCGTCQRACSSQQDCVVGTCYTTEDRRSNERTTCAQVCGDGTCFRGYGYYETHTCMPDSDAVSVSCTQVPPATTAGVECTLPFEYMMCTCGYQS
jgi:hypothetical protein